MENLEDVLKIDKKLVTTKIGSCDQFFAEIKFFKPTKLNKYLEYFLSCWPIHVPSTRCIK